ncbi:MAG: hypothetical protein ABL953_09465 [Ilumatobacteraceae bacterium]
MTRLKAFVSNITTKVNDVSLPYVALEHIEPGTGRLVEGALLEGWSTTDSIGHRAGDVRFGKLRPYLSKSYLASSDGVGSSELIVLRPKRSLDSRFLWYLTLSRPFIEWAIATSYGVKMPRTSWSALGNFDVSPPSVPRQREVVGLLDSVIGQIDVLIAEQLHLAALAQERLWVSISKVLGARVGGEADLLESGLLPCPAPWRLAQLRQVARIQSGLTLGKVYSEPVSELPYLRVANVRDGEINTEDVSTVAVPIAVAARHTLRAGDVLMTEGGDNDKLGRGAVWDGRIEPCLHQNHIFAVRPGSELLAEYLSALLTSSWGRAYFTATAHQTTNLASTNRSKVGRLPIPLPLIERQHEIVAFVREESLALTGLMTEIENQVVLLREHRQALITAAVTGHLEFA